MSTWKYEPLRLDGIRKVSGVQTEYVYYFVGEGMDEMLLLPLQIFPCSRQIHLYRSPDCFQRQRLGAGVTLDHIGKNFLRRHLWKAPGQFQQDAQVRKSYEKSLGFVHT
jgi:hypothetical protein